MSPRASATDALHTSGYRLTMQRQLVWDTLRQSKKHLSAEDLLEQIRRQYPRFNLATVYRSPGVLHDEDAEKGGIGRSLRDIILGGQDGLVNVLGLVLGVAAATAQLRIIMAAALAATFSESIAMGGVAYTSALADRDYYLAQLAKERREVEELPDVETEEVREIFRDKGLHGELLERVVKEITSDKKVWVDVMMRDELHLAPVTSTGVVRRALVTGFSTLIGSLIPLIPFEFVPLFGLLVTAR